MNKELRPFDKSIFWDVDFEALHPQKNADFIITRIFNRGDVEDIRTCRRYFGDDMVKKALLETKYLTKYRLYLASAVINRPINEFRCYTTIQFNRKHLPY